jgi:hypothetical protein
MTTLQATRPTDNPHDPPLMKLLLGLSIPRDWLRDADGRLAANPKGCKFARWGDAGDLRTYYCAAHVVAGIDKVLQKFYSTVGRGAAIKAAAEAYDFAQGYGRLGEFDRDWDLRDLVSEIEVVADWLRRARAAQREGYTMMEFGPPRWQIERLARALVERWLPAAQNIGSRLPKHLQDEVRDNLKRHMDAYLRELDRLHEMTTSAPQERKRWADGFGAVDVAILLSCAMTIELCDLADSMADIDDGTTKLLRDAAAKARADINTALAELRSERMRDQNLRLWPRRKADVVAFARAAGGIGPELEAMFHSRGSAFLGY